MRPTIDQRGSVLLYVLMAISVLMILTPVILTLSTTQKLNDKRLENEIKAHQLAASALESLMMYLEEKPASTTITYSSYFQSFAGWGNYTITLPDNTAVKYRFGLADPGNEKAILTLPVTVMAGQVVYVRVIVDAGAGNIARQKILTYKLTVPSGTGGGSSGGSIGDPDTVSPSTVGLLNPDTAVIPRNSEGAIMSTIYPNYASDFAKLLPKESTYNIVYNTAQRCSAWKSTIYNDIMAVTLSPPVDTVTVKIDCQDQTISNEIIINQRNVVINLIGNLEIDKGNLDMKNQMPNSPNGLLLVNGNLSVKNNGRLFASNIFISGTANYEQNGSKSNVTVTGTLGAGDAYKTSGTAPTITNQSNTYHYIHSDSGGTSPWNPQINQ